MSRSRAFARRTLLAAASLALAAAPAAAQPLPPARQLIDRHVQATGGTAAWARRQSQRTVAEMSMAGTTISMEMLSARPNKLLARMTMPGLGQMVQGYDGQVGWSTNAVQGPRLMEGAELAQTVRQADFDAGVDPSRNFPTVETVERTEMGGQPCYLVRMVSAEGDEVRSCFHTGTGLMVGSRTMAQTPTGESEAVTLFSDYRDFGGVKLATRTTTSVGGQEMTLVIKEVSANAVDPAVFALPAEVRALAAARPRP